jgi:hypothetical protein
MAMGIPCIQAIPIRLQAWFPFNLDPHSRYKRETHVDINKHAACTRLIRLSSKIIGCGKALQLQGNQIPIPLSQSWVDMRVQGWEDLN